MIKKLLSTVILVFIVLISIIFFVMQQSIESVAGEDYVVVEIKEGQTLSQLAYDWQAQGWLPFAKVLLIQARLLNSAKNIKPGEFEIPKNARVYEVLALLTEGKNKRYKVSFIEGTRLIDALASLQDAPKLIQDIQPLTTENVEKTLDLDGLPEGWIYPDTYVYHSGDTVSAIINQAHQRMQNVLNNEWQAYIDKLLINKIEKLPYRSAYEVLIMASIVEKETGLASERPEIAGVFIRRLRMNMRLQTDPTVIYGLGKSYEGNLRKKHLRDPSNIYNTYRHEGLPPTPIALAGRAAINAALNPDNGDSIYFVAKGDGSHYFSTSLAEHNRAVRKYQILKRSEDYRSAPMAN
jgi:UPF0755 protein